MWRTNVPSHPLSLQLNDQDAGVVLVLLGAQLFALYEQSHGGLDLGNAGQRVVALSDDKAQLGQTASATVLKGPQAQVST
jgi:hypothetical protein